MKKKNLIVFFLVVSISAICAATVGYFVSDYFYSTEAMAAIQETAYDKTEKATTAEVVIPQTKVPDAAASGSSSAAKKKVEIPIDFVALKKTNSDIIAWINIPGTNINYPIAQHPKNDSYYLKHGADGMSSSYGCLYVESCEKSPFLEFNTVVYGHNMNDGSMFAGLHLFEDKDFYDKHRSFYVYTPEHAFCYEIFAAVMYSDIRIPYYYNDLIESDRTAYLNSLSKDIVASRSIITKDYNVTEDNCIITLSTCDKKLRDNRFLVVAKLKQIDGQDVK